MLGHFLFEYIRNALYIKLNQLTLKRKLTIMHFCIQNAKIFLFFISSLSLYNVLIVVQLSQAKNLRIFLPSPMLQNMTFKIVEQILSEALAAKHHTHKCRRQVCIHPTLQTHSILDIHANLVMKNYGYTSPVYENW